jgi:hypothetical protein
MPATKSATEPGGRLVDRILRGGKPADLRQADDAIRLARCVSLHGVWATGDPIGALRTAARFFDRPTDTKIFSPAQKDRTEQPEQDHQSAVLRHRPPLSSHAAMTFRAWPSVFSGARRRTSSHAARSVALFVAV